MIFWHFLNFIFHYLCWFLPIIINLHFLIIQHKVLFCNIWRLIWHCVMHLYTFWHFRQNLLLFTCLIILRWNFGWFPCILKYFLRFFIGVFVAHKTLSFRFCYRNSLHQSIVCFFCILVNLSFCIILFRFWLCLLQLGLIQHRFQSCFVFVFILFHISLEIKDLLILTLIQSILILSLNWGCLEIK